MKIPSHWRGSIEAEELAPRTYFVSTFVGVSVFETDEGLLLVDTGLPQLAEAVRDSVREKTKAPLHSVVYTHGHVDHAFGLGPWLEEESAKSAPPRVYAHRAVKERLDRYERTRGLNEHINRVQFSLPNLEWPRVAKEPTVVYDDRLDIDLGGERFELHHGRGETDDATWLWAKDRKVLCTGDFWIGCAPNCGNPQKVQRYADEWKSVLEQMATKGAKLLLPGHGPPMKGEAEIRVALLDTARYLESIVEQTIAGLNAGRRHDEIVASVVVPPELASKPYLQPLYDRPEFIARNVIRLHAGWWDGLPSHLLPSLPDARAREIASLAGGVEVLVRRAREVADTDLSLACHLAEWAQLADPAHVAANEAVRDLFRARAAAEPSLMARSIFERAASEAEAALALGTAAPGDANT